MVGGQKNKSLLGSFNCGGGFNEVSLLGTVRLSMYQPCRGNIGRENAYLYFYSTRVVEVNFTMIKLDGTWRTLISRCSRTRTPWTWSRCAYGTTAWKILIGTTGHRPMVTLACQRSSFLGLWFVSSPTVVPGRWRNVARAPVGREFSQSHTDAPWRWILGLCTCSSFARIPF